MKKQLGLFLWWLDSAAQCNALIGATFSAAMGWWSLTVVLLLGLGAWQMASALLGGLAHWDAWRLLYFSVAAAFLILTLGLYILLHQWGNRAYAAFFGLGVLIISYSAGWYYLWMTHRTGPHRNNAPSRNTPTEYV